MTYAIMSTNNKNNKDYLANFEPFILDLLKRKDWDYIIIKQLKDSLYSEYTLELPDSIIKKILSRLKNEGYVLREKVDTSPATYGYKPNYEKLDSLNFKEKVAIFEKKYNEIIDLYKKYCKVEYDIEKTNSELESELLDFIEKHHITLLNEVKDQNYVKNFNEESETLYLTAAFISSLIDEKSPFLDDLVNITKGNMLIDTLYFEENTRSIKSLKNTDIYFDTSIVMFALGLSGEEKKRNYLELVELLKKNKAKIKIFRHNLEEIRGILSWTQHNLHTGKDNFETIQYFITNNFEKDDIELLIYSLENEIKNKLNIEVVDSEYKEEDYSFNIDEVKLKEYLISKINYKNKNALDTDVASISAIMRLRKGKKRIELEESIALFVTTNYTLTNATMEFMFSDEDDIRYIPPIMHESTVSNLVWIKNPDLSPSLPKKKLISYCYEALSPSERFWSKYLKKVEELNEQKQTVTEEDLILLRFSPLSKELIMDATFGNEDNLTSEVILESLSSIDNKQKEAIQEIKRLDKIKTEGLQKKIQELESEKANKERDELEKKKEKNAKKKKNIKIFSTGVFIIIALFLSVLIFISLNISKLSMYITIPASIIVVWIWPIMESFGVLNLPQWKRKMEDRLEKRFLK